MTEKRKAKPKPKPRHKDDVQLNPDDFGRAKHCYWVPEIAKHIPTDLLMDIYKDIPTGDGPKSKISIFTYAIAKGFDLAIAQIRAEQKALEKS